MTRPRGSVKEAAFAQLSVTPAGMSAKDLAALLGVEHVLLTILLGHYRSRGIVVSRGNRRHMLWFAPQHAPTLPAEIQLVTPQPGPALKPPGLPGLRDLQFEVPLRTPEAVIADAIASGAVVPPGVKVTVCPGGVDMRFKVSEKDFKADGFTADWNRRRASAKEELCAHAVK